MQDDEFEWDEHKAALNLANHAVSFDQARAVFRDIHAVELGEDARGYHEQRYNIIGRSGLYLLFVSYTERGNRIRIISARHAQRSERNYWIRENPPFG